MLNSLHIRPMSIIIDLLIIIGSEWFGYRSFACLWLGLLLGALAMQNRVRTEFAKKWGRSDAVW